MNPFLKQTGGQFVPEMDWVFTIVEQGIGETTRQRGDREKIGHFYIAGGVQDAGLYCDSGNDRRFHGPERAGLTDCALPCSCPVVNLNG